MGYYKKWVGIMFTRYNFSLSKVDLNFKIHPIQICADIIIGFYYLENRREESQDLDGSGLGASIMK